MKRFFSIIYISSDGASKKQYNINVALFRASLTIISVFLLGVIIMAVYQIPTAGGSRCGFYERGNAFGV